MFCPNCGGKLDEGANFCSECGFNIKNNKTSTKSSNNFLETSILENKTIIIAGLIVVAILILAIGIVSFSSHTVTIDGIDFNIPAGYEENVDLRKDNELMPIVGGFLINYNFRGYEADNGDAIAIGVSTGNGFSLTEDVMFSMAPGATKKTINSHEGAFSKVDRGYRFMYLDGEKFVQVIVSDESIFEKVIT